MPSCAYAARAPQLALPHHHLLFLAGALIMFIDDHGDCHADRRSTV